MAKISELTVSIGADTRDFKRGLADAQSSIDSAFDTTPIGAFDEAIGGAKGSVEGLLGSVGKLSAAAAGLFGLGEAIQAATDMGSACVDLARSMHVSTDEAQELYKVLQLTGGDAGTVSAAMMRLQKTYNSTGSAADTLKATLAATGVQLTDNNGKFLSINQQLQNLAKGYMTAKEAGLEQEYMMNTLGVRGQALIGTLEQYAEAKEAAAQVEGVGLTGEDLEALENFDDSMNALKLQAQQFSVALANAFMPLAQQLLPQVMSAMQETAKWIAENKEKIAEVTSAVVQLYAAYTAANTAKSILTWFSNAYTALKLKIEEAAAAEIATSAEVTAAKETELAKQLASVDSVYTKIAANAERLAAKQIAAGQMTYEEWAVQLQGIQAKHMAVAASVEARWNEAHASMAASSQRLVTATNAVTAAEERAGAAAIAAGAAQAGSARKATTAVGVLNIALGVLKANWLLVAWACYEAVKALEAYNKEKAMPGGAKTYEYNGQTYAIDKDGVVSKFKSGASEYDPNDDSTWGKTTANTHTYDVSPEEIKAIHEMAGWSGLKLEPPKPNTEAPALDFSGISAGCGGIGGTSGGGIGDKIAKAAEPKITDITEDIGEKIVEVAEASLNGVSNEIGSDLASAKSAGGSCAAYVTHMLKTAGAAIGDFGSWAVDGLIAQAGSAYHSAGSGYQRQAGDILIWSNDVEPMHTGIADSSGGHYASNSHGGNYGITHVTPAMGGDDYYNGYHLSGVISTKELTGGQKYTHTVEQGAKAAIEALNKQRQAQSDANKIAVETYKNIASSYMDKYELEMSKLEDARSQKIERLNALEAQGADTKLARLTVELEYNKKCEAIEKKRAEDEQKRIDAIDEYYQQGYMAMLKLTKADEQYEYQSYLAAQEKIDKEYALKQKELLTDNATEEQRLALEKAYHNLSEQAMREHVDKVNTIKAESTDLPTLKAWLESEEAVNKKRLESQKNLATAYKTLWNQAYMDITTYQTQFTETLSSALSSGITNILTGTKTVADAFKNMAQTIMQSMIQIIVKGMVAKMLLNLPFFSGMSFATGGFVSGPGTSTSDSIPAYLSNGEYIMTAAATKANLPLLEAMNGGLKAFAHGGIVAPCIRHFSSGGLVSGNPQGAGINVAVNIVNNSGQNVTATQTGQKWDGEKWVVDVVMNAVATNKNGMRSIIKGVANG